jgi:hypothetical protein
LLRSPRWVRSQPDQNPSNADREGGMPDKKRDDKGKPQRTRANKPDAHSAEIAFDEIIDAILGADPEAVRKHRARQRARQHTQRCRNRRS